MGKVAVYIAEYERLELVISELKKKPRSEQMTFKDSRAMLAWCEANRAALVYLPAVDPSVN